MQRMEALSAGDHPYNRFYHRKASGILAIQYGSNGERFLGTCVITIWRQEGMHFQLVVRCSGPAFPRAAAAMNLRLLYLIGT